MRVLALTAEYNPFHTGHLYQLMTARKKSGADAVLVVMSGNFTQRGEAAVTDKYARARMALACGADVVAELPVQAATGGAAHFARGAVSLLKHCGCVNALSFGTETDRPEELELLAAFLEADENAPGRARMEELIRDGLKSGLAYPKAAAKALGQVRPAWAELLDSPNNLLAVEYLRAMKRCGADWELYPVTRRGQDYGARTLPEESSGTQNNDAEGSADESTFASAGALRRALLDGKSPGELAAYLPPASIDNLRYTVGADSVSALLMSRLSGLSPEDMCLYADVTPDLARRIYACRPYLMSFTELAGKAVTKAYSLARVKRALTHILLEIPPMDPEPAAIRILGLNKSSALPGLLKSSADLPLIVKTADADPALAAPFVRAADIYHRAVYFTHGIRLADEYRQSPVIVERS